MGWSENCSDPQGTVVESHLLRQNFTAGEIPVVKAPRME